MAELESSRRRRHCFGQRRPPLSVTITGILEEYPDGQIFKVRILFSSVPSNIAGHPRPLIALHDLRSDRAYTSQSRSCKVLIKPIAAAAALGSR